MHSKQSTLDDGVLALFCPTCPVLIPYLKSYTIIPRKCPRCKTDLESVKVTTYITPAMNAEMDLVGNWAAIVNIHDIEELTGYKLDKSRFKMTSSVPKEVKMRKFTVMELSSLSAVEKATLLYVAKQKIIPLNKMQSHNNKFVGALGKLARLGYIEILQFENSAEKAAVIAGIVQED